MHGNDDYSRFLRSAAEHEQGLVRLADRLLAEKKICQANRDAIVGNARRVLEGAYMAGRCEPDVVVDIATELAKVSP
jgi:hypothetical protein